MKKHVPRGKIFNGILHQDVINCQKSNTIPLIECSQLMVARHIHDTSSIDCNFVFIQPKSIEELSNRIIRKRPGQETKESLSMKMNYAFKEIEMAKRLDWIDSIFTNDQEEDFIKKATVHLLFETYDLQK